VGVPFTSVNDLYTALRAVTDHSRPAYDGEIVGALNFGYKETIRAIASVRSEMFASYVNNFTLKANTREVDVSLLDPPLLRPTRLTAQQSGRNTAILFRYRALYHSEYEAAELMQQTGTFNTILYDVLQGKFPGLTTTTTGGTPPLNFHVNVQDITNFPAGTFVTLPLPARSIMSTVAATPQPTLTEPYYGVVTTASGTALALNPAITTTVPTALTVTALRRVIIRCANPPTQDTTGQLWYQYRPPRLVNLTEIIDPIVAEHQDMLLFYAISMYLRAVNDTEASSWLQKAQLLKSELMQDLEPLSGQNSESLDSGLWGLG